VITPQHITQLVVSGLTRPTERLASQLPWSTVLQHLHVTKSNPKFYESTFVSEMCAKKGRVARILTTLHKVSGTPVSEALKRRQRAAVRRGDTGTRSGEKSQWCKRKERKQRRQKFELDSSVNGLPHGYHSGLRVLLCGEGNFSFALALVTLFDGDGSNIIATSLDRRVDAIAAYPDLRDIEESLESSGAAVHFSVDVDDNRALRRIMKKWSTPRDNDECEQNPVDKRGYRFNGFDRIVWNFPDCGVGSLGRLAVQVNQDTLQAFFRGAKPLLAKHGEVHVAMLGDEARTAWNVAGIAAQAGLLFRAELDFDPNDFPGYSHCRTLPHASLLAQNYTNNRRNRGDDALFNMDGTMRTVGHVDAANEDVKSGARTAIFQLVDTI